MTFVVMQVKWSVILTDRLGPEILTVLERKGQVLHRVRLHVKVPGNLVPRSHSVTGNVRSGKVRQYTIFHWPLKKGSGQYNIRSD